MVEFEIKHCNDLNDFESIADNKLPALVLATNKLYNFKDKKHWYKIRHQVAGHACSQRKMIGRILEPRDEVKDNLHLLCDNWLFSEVGCLAVTLNKIVEYRKQLQTYFGVDCNLNYSDFAEAIYPIDCSTESLKKMTVEILPDDLDDLIDWEQGKSLMESAASWYRWNLYILGENCD